MKDCSIGNGTPGRYLPYLLTAIVLGVVVFVRIRLLQAPLERDEGEFAYMGQLLLRGIPPYAAAYTMKLPGTSFMYALFMTFFGETIDGIHLGLMIVNGLSAGLLYLLARRLLRREGALFSCAAFAVLSLSQSVYGVYAHATHFVVLFSLAGFILLFRYLEGGRVAILSASGLFFGLSLLMKQHAAAFITFAFLCLMRHWRLSPTRNKRGWALPSLSFLVGVALPYALVALYLAAEGVFARFWFWTVEYAGTYVSEITLAQGWRYFSDTFVPMAVSQLPFWLLAGAGVALLSMKKCTVDRFFLIGFLAISLISVCPGWYFHQHYYILLLPAAALMAGTAVQRAMDLPPVQNSGTLQRTVAALLLITSSVYGFYYERYYCFYLTPRQVTRATYGPGPFPEAIEIARYIREHTDKSDRIAVFGSEPEIFFYSDRLSATGHIYMYGLMEDQPYAAQMQQEMMRDVERVKPKFMVMVNIPSSWGATTSSLTEIVAWGERFAAERYELAGIVDIVDFYTTLYLWDDKAQGHKPDSDVFITVLKRKENFL